jgi:hypothetical protein
MTDSRSSGLEIPLFVAADAAATQIEEAVKKMDVKGMHDVEVKIWKQSAVAWTIGVKFKCPRFRYLNSWRGNHTEELGFQLTGNAQHSGGAGFVTTDGEGTGDKGALYTIWTVLDCVYLWTGQSFSDCLTRITAIR